MPTYSYFCDSCSKTFELFFYIKDYTEHPECELCHSKQTHREYLRDISSQHASIKKSDNELKTLGDLANRNRDRMTEDQKQELYKKHNAYKDEPSTKELPKGMTRMPKPKVKTKWTKP